MKTVCDTLLQSARVARREAVLHDDKVHATTFAPLIYYSLILLGTKSL
jgi:hypothetical protein